MKSKFSDCQNCPLNIDDQYHKLVLGETNSEKNLKNVKLLILAEAPAKVEVEQNRPLVGKSGKVFREQFKESKLDTVPYFISNIVLCSNLYEDPITHNIKTKNPPKEAIKYCSKNWQKFVEITEPDYILIMGSTAQHIFGIDGSISTVRGQFFKYNFNNVSNPPEVFLTYHPAYIARGSCPRSAVTEFADDFKKLYSLITGQKEENKVEQKTSTVTRTVMKLDKPFSFQFPSWMKNKDTKLVDIQNLYNGKCLFITRDVEGNKRFEYKSSNDYYYYRIKKPFSTTPVLSNIGEVECVTGTPNNSNFQFETIYEGDIKPEIKYSIDYYYQRKVEEPDIPLFIQYFDIEVYSAGERAFPNVIEVPKPINAISFKNNDEKIDVFIVDPRKLVTPKKLKYEEIASTIDNKYNITFFDSEKELLLAYCKQLRETKPDILTAWNIWFDVPYVYGRLKKLGISPSNLSPINFTTINPYKHMDGIIGGIHILDMLQLYKDFSDSVKPTYALGAIANDELGIGKVKFEGSLDELYEKNFSEFVKYSGHDTDLLYEINKKKGHIKLRDELRKICSSTWNASRSTTGLIDPLCISHAKKDNMVCKNANPHITNEKFTGAYVRNPIPGLHSWLIDFDFTALYPNVIRSCNIGPDTYIAKIDEQIAFDYIYYRQLPDFINIKLNPMFDNGEVIRTSKDKFIEWIDFNAAIVTITGCLYMGHDKKISFFSSILSHLLDTRSVYKDKKFEAKQNKNEKHHLYHNIQWAYKILANSIYGVLGTPSFRFFKLDLAKTITGTSQEATKFIGHHLSEYMDKDKTDIDVKFLDNYDDPKKYLVYQDTDSVFLSIGEFLNDKGML